MASRHDLLRLIGSGVVCTSLAGLLALAVPAGGCAGGPNLSPDAGVDAGAFRDAAAEVDAPTMPPDSAAPDGGVQFMPPRCSDATRPAPVPTGSGSYRCEAFGDRSSDPASPRLALASLPGPVVYVDDDARDGGTGTGTLTDPFRTIEQALMARPRTIVVFGGTYQLAAPATISGTLTIVGDVSTPGGRTIIEPPDGMPAFEVTGAAADATLTWLEIRGTLAVGRGAGVRVSAGASAVINNVTITGATRGVEVAGAGTLAQLEQVSVRGSGSEGVLVTSGGRASLRSVLVRDGASVGVRVAGARATLTEVAAVDNGAGGVALVDATTPAGERDLLDRVSAAGNLGFGIALAGASTRVRGTLLEATGTRNPPGSTLGAALLVRRGADVVLDDRIRSDAARGHGSRFEYNAGVGVAVADVGSRASVAGADVVWNDSVGLLVQDGGGSDLVGYSRFSRNRGAALALLGVASVPILCNAIDATRAGVIAFGGEMTASVGVGLLLASAAGMDFVDVAGNQFTANATNTAVFLGARVNFTGLNPGLDDGTALEGPGSTFSGDAPRTNTMLVGTWPRATSQLAIPDVM